ncbi:hypothetical protein [Variovorax paradoxus]|uniref:hypothetical protein n=1 Tax=Variovorax paradoxus TaxID=34073 RepID=UPI000A44EB63
MFVFFSEDALEILEVTVDEKSMHVLQAGLQKEEESSSIVVIPWATEPHPLLHEVEQLIAVVKIQAHGLTGSDACVLCLFSALLAGR